MHACHPTHVASLSLSSEPSMAKTGILLNNGIRLLKPQDRTISLAVRTVPFQPQSQPVACSFASQELLTQLRFVPAHGRSVPGLKFRELPDGTFLIVGMSCVTAGSQYQGWSLSPQCQVCYLASSWVDSGFHDCKLPKPRCLRHECLEAELLSAVRQDISNGVKSTSHEQRLDLKRRRRIREADIKNMHAGSGITGR